MNNFDSLQRNKLKAVGDSYIGLYLAAVRDNQGYAVVGPPTYQKGMGLFRTNSRYNAKSYLQLIANTSCCLELKNEWKSNRFVSQSDPNLKSIHIKLP